MKYLKLFESYKSRDNLQKEIESILYILRDENYYQVRLNVSDLD